MPEPTISDLERVASDERVRAAEAPREIVGILPNEEALEEAIAALTSAGWDRASLSVVGPQETDGPTGELAQAMANDQATARTVVVSDSDVRQMRVLTVGMAAVAGAFVVGATIIMGLGGDAAAGAVGAAIGGVAGAIAAAAAGLVADHWRHDVLESQQLRGGIPLWLVLNRKDEAGRAKEILRRFGATDIHIAGEASRAAF